MGFCKVQNQDSLNEIVPASEATSPTASPTCQCIKSSPSSSSSSSSSATFASEAATERDEGTPKAASRWRFAAANSINFTALILIGSIAFVSSGASLAWSSMYTFRLSGDSQLISEWTSWIVSAYPLSATLAPFAVFRWYYVGLRLWIVVGTLCLTLCWLLACLRQVDLYLILAGRVLGGFGTSTIYLTIPLYLSHFAKMTTNMKIERTMNTMWIVGALIQYLSSTSTIGGVNITAATDLGEKGVKGEAPATAAIEGPICINEWIVNSLMAAFALIAAACFYAFAPDSPQTLVRRERYVDARQLLEEYLPEESDEIVAKMQCFTVEEVKGMRLKQIFMDKHWIEKLVPVFGLAVFDALLSFNVILLFLQLIMSATDSSHPMALKIGVFCLGLMLGSVLRLPLICRMLSKSSLILSGAIIFIAFGILGTFYHMQSLNLSLANDYAYTPVVCLFIIAAYYAGGISQNIKLYQQALTSNRNRLAVQTLTFALSWITTFGVSYKFNHALWYIGIGWIYYNLAIVTFFLMAFVLLLLPQIAKVDLPDTPSTSERSESTSSSRASKGSDASTDITMDCVLIV